MKLSQHLGRYRWKGDHVVSLSDREEDRELTDAWERYLAQTLARQQAEQEAWKQANPDAPEPEPVKAFGYIEC